MVMKLLIFLLPLTAANLAPRQCHYYPGVMTMCKDQASDLKSFANHSFDTNLLSPATTASLSSFSSLFHNFFPGTQSDSGNKTWTLRLPIHARKVFFAQIQNNRLIDPILLNESDLQQRRVFEKPAERKNPNSLCEFDDEEQHFILLLNMTDRIARNHSHAWYVICAEFDALEDGAATDDAKGGNQQRSINRKSENDNDTLSNDGCSRCTLFKSSSTDDQCQQRFLRHFWLRDQPLASDTNKIGNVLEYTVADMPFRSARISGFVTDDGNSNFTDFHFNRSIKPNQVIFINLPSDEIVGNYAVKVDVLPEDENGGNFFVEDMKLPLILTDYLHDD